MNSTSCSLAQGSKADAQTCSDSNINTSSDTLCKLALRVVYTILSDENVRKPYKI